MDRPFFRCFACNQQLDPAFDGDDATVPVLGGLHFRAHGNYGSSLFDPSPADPEDCLEVVVCDRCLAERRSQVRVYLKDKTTRSFADAQ